MRYRVVVFDLDGTLVDSLADIAGALNRGLVALGREPVPLGQVPSLVGDGLERLIERALGLVGEPTREQVQALGQQVLAAYRASPCDRSRLYPGALELLDELGQAPGRRMAVLTNKPGELGRPLVEALGIADRFEAVIGDGDGFPRKPDTAAAMALLERFGAGAEEMLMVGDGLPDVQLARAVGCSGAAALWGYTPRERLAAEQPTYVLESIGELASIA